MTLRDYQREAVNATWTRVRQRQNSIVVMPTGAGKSHVIAKLCEDAIGWNGRVVVLAHRKELLTQNAEKIQALLPQDHVGIYSAGLRSRDVDHPIVCAGIQSIYKRAADLGSRQLVIVDECHRIPQKDEGQYRQFLSDFDKFNQWTAVVGLSATPFRTGEGEIVSPDSIFDTIAYEASIPDLLEAGFLCSLVNTPPPKTSVNMTGVDVRRGEFVQRQMEDRFDHDVNQQVAEAIELAKGRKSIIVFAAGVSHADHVCDQLEKQDQDAACIVGDTPPIIREAAIKRFKAGELRWLVNCNVLTEGFDAPRVDCVVMLRATQSPGLFAQAGGRGFRLFDGKDDCLVLDFGGNIARHGNLDSPSYGKAAIRKTSEASDDEEKEPPGPKTCPKCSKDNEPRFMFCEDCGTPLIESRPPPELDETADTHSQILAREEWYDVDEVHVYRHQKRGAPDSVTLRVDYQISYTLTISEWVCIQHKGFARERAGEWWNAHTYALMPSTVDDALDLWRAGALRMPARICAKQDGKFYRVTDRDFADIDKPESWAKIEPAAIDAFDYDDTPF